MIKLIQTAEQYFKFKDSLAKADRIVIPITNNNYIHPIYTEFNLFFVYNLAEKQGYMVSLNHPDLYEIPNIWYLIGKEEKCFVWDKKKLFHNFQLRFNDVFSPTQHNIIDINLIHWFNTNKTFEFNYNNTVAHSLITKWYDDELDISSIIPATKHVQIIEDKLDDILKIVDSYYNNILENSSSFQFFNSKVLSTLGKIELPGLKINSEVFDEHFDYPYYTNDVVYTEYNPYTSTGRPSNRFGGVNFAALNKEDGSRDSFISRYGEDGILAEFDFESHHMRIIGTLIGYKLPTDMSIHEYLGKQYFGVEDRDLTDEEYNESKKVSFQLLYGGIPQEFEDMPFLKQTSEFIDKLWILWNRFGYITCPISNKKIHSSFFAKDEINKQKLFNYLIQLYELSKNILVIDNIIETIKKYDCQLVLYTYDSLLFDIKVSDNLKDIVNDIKIIMENDGQYPIKYKVGNTYGTM